jgi:hypothetical protein
MDVVDREWIPIAICSVFPPWTGSSLGVLTGFPLWGPWPAHDVVCAGVCVVLFAGRLAAMVSERVLPSIAGIDVNLHSISSPGSSHLMRASVGTLSIMRSARRPFC